MRSNYFHLQRIAPAFILSPFEAIKITKELYQLREGHDVPQQIIQNALDGMAERCRKCQNKGGYSFPLMMNNLLLKS